MQLIFTICLTLTLLGMGLSVLRVLVKTCYPNKVLGADFMLTALISVLGVVSVYTDNLFYLDVAMLVGIIAFMSTVYFSKFLLEEEPGEKERRNSDDQ